ncbi:MAG TPA: hypothetical protein VFX44_02185 [Solirubrobacterales bacterium]|nr:hypothetical protein [Solirubrobacterales bacterium]
MGAVDTCIYGGDPLYSGGQEVIDGLRQSGMTTVVAGSLHVESSGDLVFNHRQPLVSAGKYVGEAAWPARMSSLKQAPTSVTRLLLSVGGDGKQDFHHIRQLIKEHGTGPDSILRRNFAVLKSTIPAIDGVDFDDEDLGETKTTVTFARLLHQLDYTVTFCPFNNCSFWVECLQELNGQTPGLVSGFNLQCYSGGAGNTPGPWIEAVAEAMGPDFDAKGFVRPGFKCRRGADCTEGDCPGSIEETLREWSSSGIQGGWVWRLDWVLRCERSGSCSGQPMGVAAYAQAIAHGVERGGAGSTGAAPS